jgi:hypothetical protein
VTAPETTTDGDFEKVRTSSWDCKFAPKGTGTCGYFSTPCAAPEQSLRTILH